MATDAVEAESPNPLITKLERIAELSEEDRRAIREVSANTRIVEARTDIISDGDQPDNVHLVLDGWAARYKMLPNGARQFTAFLIPGDFCDLHVTILKKMDHGIIAMTRTTVAYISHEKMRTLMEERPELTRALWWATLVDEGVLRAWIVNIGQREAYERIGNFICEMHVRLRNVGLADDGAFDLPITQEEMADTLGLTPVHVNRMIQRLRGEGLVALRGKKLRILEPEALAKSAGFDPSYLHAHRRVSARSAG